MRAVDFDFLLPESLIAKRPVEKRDCSKLLVLQRDGRIEHKKFYDLPEYLRKGDMLLLNNTMVLPVRLTGIKPTGRRMEFLLVKEIGNDTWEILSRGRYSGRLSISSDLSAHITEGRIAHFLYSGDFMEKLWQYGSMPLPPYIKRKPEAFDKERYQTVYADAEGSIAAPTAGLHFTEELLNRIKEQGINVRYLTLHVGIGTFKPIRTDDLEMHTMEPEYFEMDIGLVSEVKKVKASGGRVVSVGTTTTRAIEGYFSGSYTESVGFKPQDSRLSPQRVAEGDKTQRLFRGYTDIFIYPGYEFKVIDALITNFHLPCSTPLMLTSAFCGMEELKHAYREAIDRKYRFFSYGDAMLIL